MKIRLNMNVANHCMRMWFNEGQVYDARPTTYDDEPAYSVAGNDGVEDIYRAKWFEVVEGDDGAE